MSGWLDRPRGLFTHGVWIVLLALVVVGAFQMFVLGRNGCSPERLPQLVRGDDALAVAFGGARETISLAMVHKADSYFHGGVDMECTLDHDHDEDCDHDHGAESDTRTLEHSNIQTFEHSNSFPDPWAWINAHIRAPEVERHLEGEKAVELMPWFWASVRADPHNIDAWTTAVYMANRVMKDRALAAKILAEAKAKNPDDLELLWTEGRFVYDGGRGSALLARASFERVVELARERCGGDESKLSEHDAMILRMSREYLEHMKIF